MIDENDTPTIIIKISEILKETDIEIFTINKDLSNNWSIISKEFIIYFDVENNKIKIDFSIYYDILDSNNLILKLSKIKKLKIEIGDIFIYSDDEVIVGKKALELYKLREKSKIIKEFILNQTRKNFLLNETYGNC